VLHNILCLSQQGIAPEDIRNNPIYNRSWKKRIRKIGNAEKAILEYWNLGCSIGHTITLINSTS